MDSPQQQQVLTKKSTETNFLALLDLHYAPALLLKGSAGVVLHANDKLLQLGSLTGERSELLLSKLVYESERLQARVARALRTRATTYDNFQLREGGEVYYVTATPLAGADDLVCCTFQNICDPEPNVLWTTIERHPELRSMLFTQLPLGISQLCEDCDDFSWVYINRPTRELLSSTMNVLLERKAKIWWLHQMTSLDAVGRCVLLFVVVVVLQHHPNPKRLQIRSI